MSLFHHIHFPSIDPLGDGLDDAIAAERAEPEQIDLNDQFDESAIGKWDSILAETNDTDTNDLDWLKDQDAA